MAQTSYATAQSAAFPGMLADSTAKQTESFFNAEASAEIPFGVMVKQGTGDFTCNLLAAITDNIVGISHHSHTYEYGTTGGGVVPKDPVNVLTKGRVWVTVEDACTPASTVFTRAVATGAEVKGAFRATADGTDTIQLYGARFITSAGAGGLAMLEFDLQAHRAAVAAIATATA
jgi:hypothetical protein